eukprot:m.395498 g.395498  ORF g.395498 m.395498 type:complete len:415 (+) comp21102_c0_seq5:197-1441(+)
MMEKPMLFVLTIVSIFNTSVLTSHSSDIKYVNPNNRASIAHDPSFRCEKNFDCQLNGQCFSGSCICDPGWTGRNCHRMDLLPAPEKNGLQDTHLSSWGGSVLHNNSEGTWHMYVAIIENSCGLAAWRPNSAIGHATSSYPAGPYTLRNIIKPHFAHEPSTVRAPDGTILIYHIGAGQNATNHASGYAKNCTHRCTGADHKWEGGDTFYGPTAILHSKSFAGPWTSEDIGYGSRVPGCPKCGDTNPAPLVLANGSVRLMWRTTYFGDCLAQSCIATAFAPGWEQEYTWTPTSLFRNDSRASQTHIEDAYIWQAPADATNPGSFHALFHSDVEGTCQGAAGGHAYSNDGVTWHFSPWNAFGNVVRMQNGTDITLRQRERPHLVLDDAGHPIVLINGAGWQGDCDHVFTLAQPINQK